MIIDFKKRLMVAASFILTGAQLETCGMDGKNGGDFLGSVDYSSFEPKEFDFMELDNRVIVNKRKLEYEEVKDEPLLKKRKIDIDVNKDSDKRRESVVRKINIVKEIIVNLINDAERLKNEESKNSALNLLKNQLDWFEFELSQQFRKLFYDIERILDSDPNLHKIKLEILLTLNEMIAQGKDDCLEDFIEDLTNKISSLMGEEALAQLGNPLLVYRQNFDFKFFIERMSYIMSTSLKMDVLDQLGDPLKIYNIRNQSLKILLEDYIAEDVPYDIHNPIYQSILEETINNTIEENEQYISFAFKNGLEDISYFIHEIVRFMKTDELSYRENALPLIKEPVLREIFMAALKYKRGFSDINFIDVFSHVLKHCSRTQNAIELKNFFMVSKKFHKITSDFVETVDFRACKNVFFRQEDIQKSSGKFQNLKTLMLPILIPSGDTDLKDEFSKIVDTMSGFKNLRLLNLGGSICSGHFIEDDYLLLLKKMTQLTSLDMNYGTKITYRSVENISDLTNLKSLSVGEGMFPSNDYRWTQGKWELLQKLNRMTHLQSLNLNLYGVQFDVLRNLTGLKDLKIITAHAPNKSLDLKFLSHFTNLQSLDIYCCNFLELGRNVFSVNINYFRERAKDCRDIINELINKAMGLEIPFFGIAILEKALKDIEILKMNNNQNLNRLDLFMESLTNNLIKELGHEKSIQLGHPLRIYKNIPSDELSDKLRYLRNLKNLKDLKLRFRINGCSGSDYGSKLAYYSFYVSDLTNDICKIVGREKVEFYVNDELIDISFLTLYRGR